MHYRWNFVTWMRLSERWSAEGVVILICGERDDIEDDQKQMSTTNSEQESSGDALLICQAGIQRVTPFVG